ncbi:hypothetical protein NCM_03210 [Burkholderia pseudomallei]
MQRRTMLKLAAALGAAVCVAGAQAQTQTQTIKVGVTGGPHAQVMEEVKKVAAKHGLDIRIVEFSDYVQPNAALAAGDLDANSYQHAPYLDAQVKDRGYRIVKVADTVTFPMGIYSKRVNSLAALRAGARIAIPNDPTNGGRALVLLQKQGLLKLRDGAGLKATRFDVVDNPKQLKLVELDAALDPALARRRRRGRDQHELRDGSRPETETGRDCDRGAERSVREHPRGARRGQGQAVGREARGRLSVGRREALHRAPIRRRGDRRLVGEIEAAARLEAKIESPGLASGFFSFKIERPFAIIGVPRGGAILGAAAN